MESFLAISALSAACVIDQGLYFAMNAPAGATGGNPEAAAEFVRTLGFTISPGDLSAAAAVVEASSLLSRTGGAPTLAVGLSQLLHAAFGGDPAALWYLFAILFEALLLLSPVASRPRVA